MRVLKPKINIIKNNILIFEKSAQVYLFGSRVDDNKKGGDILIISDLIKMILSKNVINLCQI